MGTPAACVCARELVQIEEDLGHVPAYICKTAYLELQTH